MLALEMMCPERFRRLLNIVGFEKLMTYEAMRVEIAAWKPAEDGRGRILRLVETRGARGDVQVFWNIDASKVSSVDLLEKPLSREDLRHSKGAATLLRMKPFEIVTLRVE